MVKTWTPEEIERLHQLWTANAADREIAGVLGRTESSISSRASKSGFAPRDTDRRVLQHCSRCRNAFRAASRRTKVCDECRTPTDLKDNARNKFSTPKEEGTLRPCLCCTRPFNSLWIGNRICDECKGSEEYRAA